MTVSELQEALNNLGADPKLKVDGKKGSETIKAIKEFQKKNRLEPDGIVGKYTLAAINNQIDSPINRDITRNSFSYLKKGGLLTTAKLKAKYGEPCDDKNFTVVTLPFPLRLSWDKNTTVSKLTVHKAIAENIVNVFKDILIVYGIDKIKQLGIDLYGGMYNCRQMRGSGAWSVHSWALAIDLDPERNGLNTPFLKSQFSKIEYQKLHEIFYKYGFINLGIEANMDAMHFQIAN